LGATKSSPSSFAGFASSRLPAPYPRLPL